MFIFICLLKELHIYNITLYIYIIFNIYNFKIYINLKVYLRYKFQSMQWKIQLLAQLVKVVGVSE